MEEKVQGKIYDTRQLRRLLPYAWPYRGAVLLSLILLTGQTLAQVGTPLLTKVAIDYYIVKKSVGFEGPLSFLNQWLPADVWNGLAFISALFAGLLLLRLVLEYGQQLAMQYTGQRIMFDIRRKLYAHLQRLDVQFFDRNPVGRIVTRVTSDVDQLNEFFSAALITILGDLMMIGFVLLAMFRMSWQMTLIMLGILPFVVLTTMVFRKQVSTDYRRQRVAMAKLNSFLQEHTSGMSVLQLFNREERAKADFEAINRENMDAWKSSIVAYGWFYPVVEFEGMIAMGAVLAWGGFQVRDGELTVGVLVAFFQFAMRFFGPIQDLSEKYNTVQSSMAASERVFGMLDEPLHITAPVDPQSPSGEASIEFENVGFAYKGEDWILNDLSFRVAPGETVAIVGHTGAGKTSITNLMLRFYDVQRGRVKVGGLDVRSLVPSELRSQFGVVLQDPFLFTGTLRDNIRLGDESIDDARIEDACRRVNLWGFIASRAAGLDMEVQERGTGLSTGQKQLVSFARALVREPRFLILDEATSSVDTETEQLIQRALDVMLQGRTAIVIAHRLSTIQKANRILVMHKGHLRESGTHQELLRLRGIYWRLYELQYKDQETPASQSI
ncbi:ABC transporter ATP-binding protein [Bryobacter aggregatus]|uniref:ABC transporter ATP-binding protein n=1 Tax=Bryobacter aggregatus TaxID=360054 RepID=UPI0005639F22|nr:ABC transporter ATP-binding protein [Bryobacter aggregatus]